MATYYKETNYISWNDWILVLWRKKNIERTILPCSKILVAKDVIKQFCKALTGMAQWVGQHPANQKVASSIPGQGRYLGWGPGPQLGDCNWLWCFSASFPFSLNKTNCVRLGKPILAENLLGKYSTFVDHIYKPSISKTLFGSCDLSL